MNRFRYPEGTHGPASLRYHGPVPVLRVVGSPEEIAEQAVALAIRPAVWLLDYPLDLLTHVFRFRFVARWLLRALDRRGRKLIPRFPLEQQRELLTMASLLNDERILVANTLFDLKNLQPWRLFGCSSLAPLCERTTTGGPLLARNLDFFDLGYLHEYSLVTVYAPATGRQFALVGFPGSVGCFSGMNDAGLAIVTHEVFGTRASGFNARGVPFAAAVRRALETCETVDEAERAIRSMPCATTVSLVLCDRDTSAVLEVTPRSVVRRSPIQAMSLCTNHFLSPGHADDQLPTLFGTDRRHRLLEQVAASRARLGVSDLFATLHTVNMGSLTIQSMVFDPRHLRLYLAIGNPPTTAQPPAELRLSEWFR